MADKTEEIKEEAQAAIADEDRMKALMEDLAGASRRSRQHAASVILAIARTNNESLAPYIGDLVDALNRPEAQTRWQCLDALSHLVAVDSRVCDRALPGAEAALFDENNGLLHLAAMKFLASLGATTKKRSEKVWPLINEGIQCYHGDPEFQEMLVAVISFSEGKLDPEVKEALKERMSFDAEHGKGALQRRAAQIVANLQ